MKLKLINESGEEVISIEQLKVTQNDVLIYPIDYKSLDLKTFRYIGKSLADTLGGLGVKLLILPKFGSDSLQIASSVNMVRIPISIGSKLYWRTSDGTLEIGRVSMIQQKADFSWKIRISYGHGNCFDIKESEIGVDYFLSSSKARFK